MKRLNLHKFKELKPCMDGYKYVLSLKTTDLRTIFNSLESYKLEWANWLVSRLLSRKDKIRYAIFSAEQVIDIFEKKYPNDKRPRQAIEAAKAVLEKNNKTTAADAANKEKVTPNVILSSTAYAAYAAADTAYAADAANTAYAADAAAYAADAADAANTACAMKIKIVEYGLTIIGVNK